MSNDAMDAEDNGQKNAELDIVMDVCDSANINALDFIQNSSLHTPEKENSCNKSLQLTSSQGDSNLGNVPLSPAVTNTTAYHSQQNSSNERGRSVWTVKSPMLVRPCPRTYANRRKSQENYSKNLEKQPNSADKTCAVLRGTLGLIDAVPSAFKRKEQNQNPFMDIDIDGSILKRCNSAPILNDPEVNSIEWNKPAPATSGRIRRFSANVVSLTSSPSSGIAKSRLRLHQLKKEESIEGIQNKEAEHEREVQTTLQISSNCGDLTLGDRRSSLDGISPSSKANLSPTAFPVRSHFPTPPSSLTGVRSSSSRAIDFNSSTSGPIHPPSHHTTPGGIPSPLTFSASPSLLNISPLPSSPTRAMCGPGKQCFSPSMHIPVCLARAASRSPSPSPTRRTFVTRRRSQSPCIMRPSALGPIKRKYDSDSEGSCSPKRMFLPSSTGTISSASGDGVASSAVQHSLVQRSHSLSSSSVDSSDMYVSPSPPHHPTTFVTNPHHHHGSHPVSGFVHPLQYSSSPLSTIPVLQTHDSSNRSNSPTNSTCSSSSLEGLRDLPPLTSVAQPLTSAAQRQIAVQKKT